MTCPFVFFVVQNWEVNFLYLCRVCLSYPCRMELEFQLALLVAGLARKGLFTSWICPSCKLRLHFLCLFFSSGIKMAIIFGSIVKHDLPFQGGVQQQQPDSKSLWREVFPSARENFRKREGVQKSMGHEVPKDWGADLSPCNFATTHFLAGKNVLSPRDLATTHLKLAFWVFIFLELRDPWNGGPLRKAPEVLVKKWLEEASRLLREGLVVALETRSGTWRQLRRGSFPEAVMHWTKLQQPQLQLVTRCGARGCN